MLAAAFVGGAGGVFATGRRVACGAVCARHDTRLRRSAFLARPARKVRTENSVRATTTRCALDTGLALAELVWIPYAITATEVALNLFNFFMVVRIILSWYPQKRLEEQPWIFVAVPTEPLLAAMRKVVKPVGGVDISPIVWFALGSFLHEILVGQQGLLILVQKYF